jgi:hypothetical protein
MVSCAAGSLTTMPTTPLTKIASGIRAKRVLKAMPAARSPPPDRPNRSITARPRITRRSPSSFAATGSSRCIQAGTRL